MNIHFLTQNSLKLKLMVHKLVLNFGFDITPNCGPKICKNCQQFVLYFVQNCDQHLGQKFIQKFGPSFRITLIFSGPVLVTEPLLDISVKSLLSPN